MASKSVTITTLGALLLAVFYQWSLKDWVFVTFGIGRVMQSIEDFPYDCRRIRNSHLEGCEDMWLDDEARVLYAACSGSTARGLYWNPSVSKLNVSGRTPGGDYVSVLNIDDPGTDGLFGLHQLKPTGYIGAIGDGTLDLHGFDVEVVNSEKLRFWMINHRPPVDADKRYLDATKVGANSTVEVFEVTRGSDEMVHIKTIADKAIDTPNKLAATGNGGFVMTNDKSSKVGLRRELDILLGGGSLTYCGATECHIAADGSFNYPNGMTKGKDGLYYIPSSIKDNIRVMELQSDLMLKEVDVIHVGMPIDNLSVDRNGDIYAAAFPKILRLLDSFKDPHHVDSPSTIWRIHKAGLSYEVKKMLEDREAKTMGGATVARHDAKSGMLFIGGAAAPYITVCNPR